MPYFDSDGVRLYYQDIGSGPPIILLHGFTVDSRMWGDVIPLLQEHFRLLLLDARGHGKSSAPKTNYAREDRARDVLNLADFLGLDKFHLIGMSMGGADAICFAIDHSDRLFSLTLVGTTIAGWKSSKKFYDYGPEAKERGVYIALEQYKKSILSRFLKDSMTIYDKLELMMNDFSGGPWLDPQKGQYQIRKELLLVDKLTIPTQIIIGKKDIYFMPLAEELHRKIIGSELAVIPGAGHMVNMENPEAFNQTLLGFLNSISKNNG